MKKEPRLTAAGAEIVESLEGFLTAPQEGGDLAQRFTIRTYDLRLEPRVYTAQDLKRTREMLGLSQALFARFLGTSVKSIRAWEGGQRKLSRMVCRFLDEILHSPEYWTKRIQEMIVAKNREPFKLKARQRPPDGRISQ